MGSSKPDKDDVALFRNTVGKVNPIKQDAIYHQGDKPAPIPAQRLADEAKVIHEMAYGSPDTQDRETGDGLMYKKPGIQNRVFQKLKRGQFAITAELDLHGLTAEEAKNTLADFLSRCAKCDRCCVKIIHGKGLRSKDGRPVIKNNIGRWLQQRQDVLAYCPAKRYDGDTGALYVLIRKNARL